MVALSSPLRVTFDTNTWQHVVVPERFPRDARRDAMLSINSALSNGVIKGFICETVATLEAVPKDQRHLFLQKRSEDLISFDWRAGEGNKIEGTVTFNSSSVAHPGLRPVLTDRLEAAFDLGLRLLPSSRIGTVRPTVIDREEFRIPLSSSQREDVWPLLARIDELASDLEARGLGKAALDKTARRMRAGRDGEGVSWFDGLEHATTKSDLKEISANFAEWADGDTVALHVGYEIDLLCTEDFGKEAGSSSVFSQANRAYLSSEYGVRFCSITELAEMIALIPR